MSNLTPLWEENIFHMMLIFYLLRLVLLAQNVALLNIPCALEKKSILKVLSYKYQLDHVG